MNWRWTTASLALVMGAAACSGGNGELTFDEYVSAMEAAGSEFLGEPRPEPIAESPPAYPLGGDLVGATELYTQYDGLLAEWRSIVPPAELRDEHHDLVAALDELQRRVGDYLMDEALESGELEFDTIAAKLGFEIGAAEAACRALHIALDERGAGPIFGDCTF